ncbi:MAG: hypothetical protein FWB86_14350 [Treponema sp.]|nr:hypothetical protein [Treponema sp.]
MRISEIMGFRRDFFYNKYIAVCEQYCSDSNQDCMKTKENRSIPMMPEIIAILRKLILKNGNGYVFSLNNGTAPATRNYCAMDLNKAFNKIGISKEEIKS